MLVAAVCILFLDKLKWPKNKSVYKVEFAFKIQSCILCLLYKFPPNIILICYRHSEEEAFSSLSHFITSENNCLVQEQF